MIMNRRSIDEPRDEQLVPVRALTPDAATLLAKAMIAVSQEPRALSDLRREAKEIADRSKRRSHDEQLARALADANALWTAAASRGCENFPDEMRVASVIGAVDVETALGRLAQIRGQRQLALQHFHAALQELRQLRAYSSIHSLDDAIIANASKFATVAGGLSAESGASLENFLSEIDDNITRPFERLMAVKDLSGPRAFGVVSLMRRYLSIERSEAKLAEVRADFRKLKATLEPSDDLQKRRFQIDSSAILEEIDALLGEKQHVPFSWR